MCVTNMVNVSPQCCRTPYRSRDNRVAVQNRNSMILDTSATVVARQRTLLAAEADAIMADVLMGDVVDTGAGA